MDVGSRTNASDYLRYAIEEIDGQLGGGYAKAHPELIGAFMQTVIADIAVDYTLKAAGKLSEAVNELATAPLMGEKFEDVAHALREIATVIEGLTPKGS
jgi:ABC-type taurine transport system substrate-binding protein